MAKNGLSELSIKNEARIVALEYLCAFIIRDAKTRGSKENWDNIIDALNNMRFVNGKDEPMLIRDVELAREGVRTVTDRIEAIIARND